MKMIFNSSSKSFVICLITFFIVHIPVSIPQEVNYEDQKVRRIEYKADCKAKKQDYSKAISIYESAFRFRVSASYLAALHLKVARLYSVLLNYPKAALHYESAMVLSDKAFGVEDVCNYMDALRITGQQMKAISLSRKYMCNGVIGIDLRFLNRATALRYGEGVLPVGWNEYDFCPMAKTKAGLLPSWIGVKENEYIYSISLSMYHDPFRRFYYKTEYYTLAPQSEFSDNNSIFKKKKFLSMIPSSLKNGPVSFSQDGKKLIATQVYFNNQISGKKGDITVPLNLETKLLYSCYNEKRKKWSSFKDALPQREGYSYAHPCLFNDGKSLLFSSDMPGGYGGYDIYIAHWDDAQQLWGKPVNLGPLVNTQGDEISPNLHNDVLVFASNGHPGFGGYDIYQISYSEGQVVAGSLVHYDYPINSISNEFSLLYVDQNSGFVLSDRSDSGDNIYFFERNERTETRDCDKNLLGMSEVRAISTGSINLLNQESNASVPVKVSLPSAVREEQMLSVFFDFNSSDLRDDALKELQFWKNETNFSKVASLEIAGYADEIGTVGYNLYLSGQRADQVREWLKQNGVSVPMKIFAKGQVPVKGTSKTQAMAYSAEGMGYNFARILQNKIWMMRDARRVDIKVIIK